ncbi:TetR-like C-terminal domain-containing protein [Nocardia sp. CA-151230]|uniref:TetR-like C-terminal domain-containing protein n=1 Tax=Nocardia sp. CA-151230 TaxID=3239982 RepID=UPI003D8B081F
MNPLTGPRGTSIGGEHHNQQHRRTDRAHRREERNQKTCNTSDFEHSHPGHSDVVFRRDLLDVDDERLIAANEGSGRELRTGVAELDTPVADLNAAQLAAWSLVHGFAALWHAGTLTDSELGGGDPEELDRDTLRALSLVADGVASRRWPGGEEDRMP